MLPIVAQKLKPVYRFMQWMDTKQRELAETERQCAQAISAMGQPSGMDSRTLSALRRAGISKRDLVGARKFLKLATDQRRNMEEAGAKLRQTLAPLEHVTEITEEMNAMLDDLADYYENLLRQAGVPLLDLDGDSGASHFAT